MICIDHGLPLVVALWLVHSPIFSLDYEPLQVFAPQGKNRVFHVHCVDVSSWFGLIADLCYRWWLSLTPWFVERFPVYDVRSHSPGRRGLVSVRAPEGGLTQRQFIPGSSQRVEAPRGETQVPTRAAGWMCLPPESPSCQANENWRSLGSFYLENVHYS